MTSAQAVDAPFPTGPGAPPAFHLLAKPTGAVCNLDCAYCFFLSKEMLYPGSRFRMADELLETYLRQLIEAHAGPEVTVAWQGGEPTLMGSTSSAARSSSRRLPAAGAARRLHDPDERDADRRGVGGVLPRARFLVGVSIDGPRELHDAYRVNKGGKGSFDEVMRGLGHLRAAGVEWNALTTIHAANGDRGREVYRFLRDECGARFVQLIPIIERVAEAAEDGSVPWTSWRDRPLYVQDGDRVTGRSVTPEQYGRFLIDVFEEWVRRDVGEVYVQMFDVALANWVGEPPGSASTRDVRPRARARAHRRRLLVRPLRRAALPAREHQRRRCASSSPRRSSGSSASTSATRCRSSAASATCASPATAAARRTASSDARRRARPQLPLRRLQGVLPPRRPADADDGAAARRRPRAVGDHGLYATEDAARGRNDPCTCGSGRKWKRCHGDGAPVSGVAAGSRCPRRPSRRGPEARGARARGAHRGRRRRQPRPRGRERRAALDREAVRRVADGAQPRRGRLLARPGRLRALVRRARRPLRAQDDAGPRDGLRPASPASPPGRRRTASSSSRASSAASRPAWRTRRRSR